MKRSILVSFSIAVASVGCVASMSASAAPLSAKECHSWPFVHTASGVTHHQLMRELKELESVGYRPTDNDVYYPEDIQTAEHRLHVEYREDCAAAHQQM